MCLTVAPLSTASYVQMGFLYGPGSGSVPSLCTSHMTVSEFASVAVRRSLVFAKSLVNEVDDVLVARESCSSVSPACLTSHFAVAGEPLPLLDTKIQHSIRLLNTGAAVAAPLAKWPKWLLM